MLSFSFKKKAAKEIDKLSPSTRRRILGKLKFYSDQKDPLKFADKLKERKFGEYRFRVGDYRILFDVEDKEVLILKVGHRKDVYN